LAQARLRRTAGATCLQAVSFSPVQYRTQFDNANSLLLTKESVILYVAHDNHGAAKVYHRVGFQGLSADAAPVEGVDPWLEIGFDRNQVKLGHW
jgi:hypothetical protein